MDIGIWTDVGGHWDMRRVMKAANWAFYKECEDAVGIWPFPCI
jgi:hypothetical protein